MSPRIKGVAGAPVPEGSPETHLFALRGYMNHTLEVLKESKNCENGAISAVLEFFANFPKIDA